MQRSSADTNFTFGDNVVAVAESGNQCSPATGDSGAASGTTWNNIPSRRSKSSASSRSVGRSSRRSTPQSGPRTPRRSNERPGTPRSIQDRSPRTRDTPGKRRTDGPEHFSLEQAAREEILEFQGEYEVELMTNQMLEDKVRVLEPEVVFRNQVIGDIEVKFTDYLRGYHQTVNSEVETRNGMLNKSTTKVREYQAELMVAAQDDEGSTQHHVRTTFGSCDVEKVHAVVARSTFPSQKCQKLTVPDHFWKLRCRKSARRCGAEQISK